MPITVSTFDIARASKVSPRTVQLHLERTRERRPGESWSFDFCEGVALVNEVVAARKRRRQNVNTRHAVEVSPSA